MKCQIFCFSRIGQLSHFLYRFFDYHLIGNEFRNCFFFFYTFCASTKLGREKFHHLAIYCFKEKNVSCPHVINTPHTLMQKNHSNWPADKPQIIIVNIKYSKLLLFNLLFCGFVKSHWISSRELINLNFF